MKPAAYICVLLMLFLMAQPIILNCKEKAKPCMTAKTSCGGNSCSLQKAEEKTEPKERSPQDACNPFASCSQCQFMAVIKTEYFSAPEHEQQKKMIPRNEDSCSDFTGDCWNPPEMA